MDRSALQYRCDVAAWIIVGTGLIALLWLHLLTALLAGLLVYEIVHVLAPRLGFLRISREWGKVAAVGVLAFLIVVVLVAGCVGVAAFFRSETGSLTALINKLAEILDGARHMLPAWVVEHLPAGVDALKETVVQWLKDHARELQSAGKDAGLGAVHVLIGMVIGAMVALHDARSLSEPGPLSRALQERVVRLGEAFRRIVFAQVQISGLNTILTAIFLVAFLPILEIRLPLIKTMIVVTFFAGLLPVVGNLISNSVIVLVGLSVSLTAAVACLAFLVIIHKLEYFVNARIVSSKIHARAWELLLAMLMMESIFGIAGIVAAPIFYAYLKDELKSRGLL